ncbi:hypothetical protein BZA70DRAFT_264993 [Myxozyma melibiosi]|uniref:Uncharacterized protein n=1 Tax=Myxozyma melibiosi TaxID=54550 RepID=A0ABR1FCR2_9ASCO
MSYNSWQEGQRGNSGGGGRGYGRGGAGGGRGRGRGRGRGNFNNNSRYGNSGGYQSYDSNNGQRPFNKRPRTNNYQRGSGQHGEQDPDYVWFDIREALSNPWRELEDELGLPHVQPDLNELDTEDEAEDSMQVDTPAERADLDGEGAARTEKLTTEMPPTEEASSIGDLETAGSSETPAPVGEEQDDNTSHQDPTASTLPVAGTVHSGINEEIDLDIDMSLELPSS